MIPKEAFWSIAAVMGVFWIFGVVCDRLIIKWTESRKEPEENPDHERWEDDPEPTCECVEKTEDKSCSTCRHNDISVLCEPCYSCNLVKHSKWEAKA